MTKRRVQGGGATSERRRRDGVSGKSHQGGLTPSSLKTSVRRARVSRASRAWQVRAARSRAEVSSFAIPHDFSHTTRANISHEKTEQIRARIVCTPAINAWRGLTHMRSMCVGVAETGHRGWSLYADGKKQIFFILSIGCTWTLSCRGEHRSPAIIHKDTFSFLVLFTDEKYQKSYKRRSASYISPPVASRRPVRTKCPDRPAIA